MLQLQKQSDAPPVVSAKDDDDDEEEGEEEEDDDDDDEEDDDDDDSEDDEEEPQPKPKPRSANDSEYGAYPQLQTAGLGLGLSVDPTSTVALFDSAKPNRKERPLKAVAPDQEAPKVGWTQPRKQRKGRFVMPDSVLTSWEEQVTHEHLQEGKTHAVLPRKGKKPSRAVSGDEEV